MPYKEMYIKLFNCVSQTIETLQEIQQQCEALYIAENPREPIHWKEREEQPVLPQKDTP